MGLSPLYEGSAPTVSIRGGLVLVDPGDLAARAHSLGGLVLADPVLCVDGDHRPKSCISQRNHRRIPRQSSPRLGRKWRCCTARMCRRRSLEWSKIGKHLFSGISPVQFASFSE